MNPTLSRFPSIGRLLLIDRKNHWLAAGLSLTIFILTGCVNLSAVKNFASQAGSVTDEKGVSADFAASKTRLQLFAGREAQEHDLARERVLQQEFDQRLELIKKYMDVLEALADDNLPSFDAQAKQLGDAVTATKLVNPTEVGLFADVANLVARGLTDYSRQKKIKQLVENSDRAIQEQIDALLHIVRTDYLGLLNNEKSGLDSFQSEISAEKNSGLTRVSALVLHDHDQLIDQKRATAEVYAKALEKIERAHATLAHNISDFTAKEAIAQLKQYSDDLKQLKAALHP